MISSVRQITAACLGIAAGILIALNTAPPTAQATHRVAEVMPGNGDVCSG